MQQKQNSLPVSATGKHSIALNMLMKTELKCCGENLKQNYDSILYSSLKLVLTLSQTIPHDSLMQMEELFYKINGQQKTFSCS